MSRRSIDLRTKCGCGGDVYPGGWCFKCGRYCPDGRRRDDGEAAIDEKADKTMGHRLAGLRWPPNAWNA